MLTQENLKAREERVTNQPNPDIESIVEEYSRYLYLCRRATKDNLELSMSSRSLSSNLSIETYGGDAEKKRSIKRLDIKIIL